MTARPWEHFAAMPYEDLVAFIAKRPDDSNPVEYQEWLLAAQAIDTIHTERRDADRKAAREKAKAAEAAAKRTKKREERVDAARVNGVVLPRWWFTSGRWGKLDSPGLRIAPAIAALCPGAEAQHVTLEEVAMFASVSVPTAKRGMASLVEEGLVRKHTKRAKFGNLVRSSIFISIPGAQHGST